MDWWPVNNRKECVIYCRVSSWHQTRGGSLAFQAEDCLKYAREQGWSVAAIFGEVRPRDGKLPVREWALKMARERQCRILVTTLDRWSRARAEDEPPVPRSILTFAWKETRECERRIEALLFGGCLDVAEDAVERAADGEGTGTDSPMKKPGRGATQAGREGRELCRIVPN